MTQLELARQGAITPQMAAIAEEEGIDEQALREAVASGLIVIPANINHPDLKPAGIGRGLRIKVNANIGLSGAAQHPEEEESKLAVALEAGADAVMDLSTGTPGEIDAARSRVIAACPVPVGTVPIYQAAVRATEERGAVVEMTADDMFAAIEAHAQDGADFVTVHCGVTRAAIDALRASGRVMDIVSRGGAFLAAWILHHGRENPLYEQFDRLLGIVRKYDVTLSLGDGFRPGSILDATDAAQLTELITLGQLVLRSRAAGVQVMVEGPGHIPLHQVKANVQVAKAVCHDAPFYVLGPLVTDIAAGYDHIAGAIGGALAGWAGADFLCYVTPAEHLGLPTPEHVREGVIASRIAAHAAGLARGDARAWSEDRAMSEARKKLDWPGQMHAALDRGRAEQLRCALNPTGIKTCSMCGELCAVEMVGRALRA